MLCERDMFGVCVGGEREREEGVGRGRSLSSEGNASSRGVSWEDEDGIQNEEESESLVERGRLLSTMLVKFCSPLRHMVSVDCCCCPGGEGES